MPRLNSVAMTVFVGALVLGKFELAHGTTILLDEIGELELGLQAKLLRVLQEKKIQRIGARSPIDVDFRLVATTNRELGEEVRRDQFREDLYYRLNVIPVRVTPLRDRPTDVRLLLQHFSALHERLGHDTPTFSSEALELLEHYRWPGNVRELENLVARMVLTCPGSTIRPDQLGLPRSEKFALPSSRSDAPFRTVREMERWLMVNTLTRLQGNSTQSARELGISLRTLRNKIHEYQITEPETLPRERISARARPGSSRGGPATRVPRTRPQLPRHRRCP